MSKPKNGEFASFQQWVARAESCLDPHCMCIDAKGRFIRETWEFMRARDEDAFPVRYWNAQREIKAAGPPVRLH